MTKKILTPSEQIASLEARIKTLEENQNKMGKRRKDPNAPKRKPTPYQLYVKDAIAHIKKENPNIEHKEAFKEAVNMWNEEKARQGN